MLKKIGDKSLVNLFLGMTLVFFMLVFPNVAKATSDDRITGAMTSEDYKNKYSALNEAQNNAWNEKYNFKPETNVKEVSTWAEFQAAYEDNSVSKIVLKNDIKSTVNARRYDRVESIEIDGNGFLLEMITSSLNVDNLANLESFTKNFSDVPVFHIHDIQIINNTGYGALEGNLSTAWAFINGNGQFGPGGAGGGRRGLWQYRMGNIITPYDESKATSNQRVGGRLFNAELGQIDIWGYNKIVTGAENFYTGGIRFEPSTYYRGEIAYYNYSTIWFMLNPAQVGTGVNRNNLTGSQQFDIGEASFVYLHNTNTGTGYPAVYEHYNLLRVGENATYNANVPGTAVSFNESNSSFIAMKDAKVNLLSRRSGAPTMSLVQSNSTHGIGSTLPPPNTSYQINEGAELYVVGTNTNANYGVVNFGYGSTTTGQIVLNNPAAFDIRNQTNTNFMGQGDASDLFNIINSDISLWKNTTLIDGMPDIDSTNVTNFSVVPTGTSGVVTSTDSKLQNGYLRNQFKRISGFNTVPELIWEPVTDADYTQKAKVLLGYVPTGGDNPFDENGDAKVTPVYADGFRIAKADFTDSLGNTYTATSQDDGYLYWKKDDHIEQGFQLAGKEITGVPFRVDSNDVRYRDGEEAGTPVVDVTPPEPAEIDKNVTIVTKKITGTGEALSKLTITINGVNQDNLSTTVNAEGKWEIAIPKGLLKKDDKIQFFLEDNAPQIISDKEEAESKGLAYLPENRIPETNSITGNINPKVETTYSDATFKAATTIVVQDVEPPTPKINKLARALTKDALGNQIPQTENTVIQPEEWQGTLTKVNNTLSYRIIVQIPGVSGEDEQKVLYNTAITDVIPDYLTFDPSDVKVWNYKIGDSADGFPIRYLDNVINSEGKHEFNMGDIDLVSSEATANETAIVEYDETSRLLTVGLGDTSKNIDGKFNEYGYEGDNQYGHLLPGDKVVVEFPTKVTSDAVKTTIKNTAIVSGYSAELISEEPEEYKKISVTSNVALSPGGDVSGELLLISAPSVLSFGEVNLIDYDQPIGSDKTSIDEPLIVKDTLKDKDWKVTVNLIEELTYQNNQLPNSLYVRFNNQDTTLLLNSPTTIYESDILNTAADKEEFVISDSWSKDVEKDGIKLKASQIPHAGKYQGTLEWSLSNTQ